MSFSMLGVPIQPKSRLGDCPWHVLMYSSSPLDVSGTSDILGLTFQRISCSAKTIGQDREDREGLRSDSESQVRVSSESSFVPNPMAEITSTGRLPGKGYLAVHLAGERTAARRSQSERWQDPNQKRTPSATFHSSVSWRVSSSRLRS